MLLKYIQHFVSPEGKAFFPGWMQNTVSKMQAIEGFVAAHYAVDQTDTSKIHFFMYFRDQAALERWTHANQHDSVLKVIEPYWVKPYIMKQVEV